VAEDLEVGVRLDPDIKGLQDDLEGADLSTGVQGQGPGARGNGPGGALLGAEAGSDLATGAAEGGLLGKAGSLSTLATIATAVTGIVALLEPVQKLLSGILAQFELLVTPLVGALLPVLNLLNDAVIQVLRFFRNPDQFISGILDRVARLLQPLINSFISAVNEIPGVQASRFQAGGGGIEGEFRSQARSTDGRAVGVGERVLGRIAGSPGGPLGPVGEGVEFFLLSDDAKTEKRSNNSEGLLGELF
jgi:hypothetical protein